MLYAHLLPATLYSSMSLLFITGILGLSIAAEKDEFN